MNKNLITNKLIDRKIRPSIQRVMVFEYLDQMQNHPTADEIYKSLKSKIPSLSKATIYNTLNMFLKAGLVRIVSTDGVEKRFDTMLQNHGHFKCDNCGTIMNFEIDIDQIPTAELLRFEVREKNVYFNGLCPNCLGLEKKE